LISTISTSYWTCTESNTKQEALIQLGRDAWKRGWWLAYSDLYVGSYLRGRRRRIHDLFHALHLLPGLFQTKE